VPGESRAVQHEQQRVVPSFTVSGTTSFTFGAVGSTIQTKPAITNWTGATVNAFQPDAANDGIGFIGSKVTNPSPGVWHYEYAVYNENLDRAIQSFSVPIAAGTTPAAPISCPSTASGLDRRWNNRKYRLQQYALESVQNASSISWASETLAQNPNANAIRWGTLYNFRFDANRPPSTATATVGFYKTGAPITVQIQAHPYLQFRLTMSQLLKAMAARRRQTSLSHFRLLAPTPFLFNGQQPTVQPLAVRTM
jgi:hypothetical protein